MMNVGKTWRLIWTLQVHGGVPKHAMFMWLVMAMTPQNPIYWDHQISFPIIYTMEIPWEKIRNPFSRIEFDRLVVSRLVNLGRIHRIPSDPKSGRWRGQTSEPLFGDLWECDYGWFLGPPINLTNWAYAWIGALVAMVRTPYLPLTIWPTKLNSGLMSSLAPGILVSIIGAYDLQFGTFSISTLPLGNYSIGPSSPESLALDWHKST